MGAGGFEPPWLSRRVYSPFPLAARAHPRGARIVASACEALRRPRGRRRARGSTTAIRLADAGARVLLVDKARSRATSRAGRHHDARVRALPGRPDAGRRGAGRPVELRFRYADSVVRQAPAPVIRMTQRRRLDASCSTPRASAGWRFARGTTIDARPRRRTRRRCRRANGTPRRRSVSAVRSCTASRSRETWLRRLTATAPRTAVVELADIPGGYGWVFPKGDHVNVGVGAWQDEGPRLREHLARVCAAHGLDPEQLESCAATVCRSAAARRARRGARAARRRRRGPDRSGLGRRHVRVLRLIEARGGGDPRRPARRLPGALDAAVGRLHSASWKLKQALDRWPRASWHVARTQLLWRSVERLLLGDVAAPADVHGVARVPLRVLDTLARID